MGGGAARSSPMRSPHHRTAPACVRAHTHSGAVRGDGAAVGVARVAPCMARGCSACGRALGVNVHHGVAARCAIRSCRWDAHDAGRCFHTEKNHTAVYAGKLKGGGLDTRRLSESLMLVTIVISSTSRSRPIRNDSFTGTSKQCSRPSMRTFAIKAAGPKAS